MREYLIKTIKFSGLLLVWCMLMFGSNWLVMKYNPPRILNGQVLIMGDSHPQRALDPKEFPKAKNVSQVAEPLYITYWKLKAILEHSSIDTVLLGLSYHNLSDFNDLKLKEQKWAPEMFKRTYSIEQAHTLDSLEVDWEELYGAKFRNQFLYPKWQHGGYIGSYSNSNKNKIDDYKQAINRHYCWEDEDCDLSETVVAHLDSIVNLCEREQVELVVVAAPLHKRYRDLVPRKFELWFDQVGVQPLRAQGITVLDYSDADYADELFLNSDHLNKKGATRFTREVRARMRQ